MIKHMCFKNVIHGKFWKKLQSFDYQEKDKKISAVSSHNVPLHPVYMALKPKLIEI